MLWVFLVLVFFLVFLGLLLLLLLVWGFFCGLFYLVYFYLLIVIRLLLEVFLGSEILFINNNKIIRFFFVEGGEILFSFVVL